MRNSRLSLLVFAFAGAITLAFSSPAQGIRAVQDTPDTGVVTTIEGLVRDVACPMQNHKSTATHFNLKCAEACAKNGSPLIILTKADEIYFPMTDQMPDRSVRDLLVPYVGKFVRVTGTVYRRNGTRTIVLKSISTIKDVTLDPNLGDD